MAPARVKKAEHPTRSSTTARHDRERSMSPVRTPQRSPQRPAMRITAAQKQALIDNLQLEVTERARKLRAQYALQARSLRTRIELRVNRIPTAMRKAKVGELYAKYEMLQDEKQVAPTGQEIPTQIPKADTVQPISSEETLPPKNRGKKRNSDAMEVGNRDRVKIHEDPIPNPKKRTKVDTNAASRQQTGPSTVLSPKSANSRTLPHSPIRSNLGSPQKGVNSRPASPLKPIPATGKTATAAATAALAGMIVAKTKPGRPKAATKKQTAARTAKQKADVGQEMEGLRTVSSTSTSSATSTGTTIVKAAKKPPAANKKKSVRSKPAGEKVVRSSEAPAKGRRVLRTRG